MHDQVADVDPVDEVDPHVASLNIVAAAIPEDDLVRNPKQATVT